MNEMEVLKNSGKPPIGTICSNCKDECQDEHGVYAYSGQITPKAFCSECKQAAIDHAILCKRDFIQSYSKLRVFSLGNWGRKRSGGRTKRYKGRSKTPVLSPLDKLMQAGVVVDEV